jgi:hypothetical protein
VTASTINAISTLALSFGVITTAIGVARKSMGLVTFGLLLIGVNLALLLT